MEYIKHHPLIIVTQEEVRRAREHYNLEDPTRLEESLKAIEEWMAKQDHLVGAIKYLNRNILEQIFLISRCSVEGTKVRIDKFLTSRGMMPEICMNRSAEEFDKFYDIVTYIPLPRLCPTDLSRVMVAQFVTEKADDFNLLTYFRYCFMIGEYRLNFDYSLAERYIIDLSNVQLSHLSKVNPILLKKCEILASEGFGTQIKGIHLVNAPPFVDRLVFLIKQAIREKVAKRLHVHSNYEDLQKHIPKEILPKDFGGDEQSCEKLSARWKETLRGEEARKIIKETEYLVSDESRRKTTKFNEEYLGMPGSFRKLNVD